MPKATAVWLVENTALTFEQIADFCGLHPLEVQAIADGEVATGMQGMDPVASGELTQEEIDRCVANPNAKLKPAKTTIPKPKARAKGARYTPVAKRQDRPDAIAWLLKNYPELSDAQISKLIGTTKPTINSVRERTHWNAQHIKPQNPVSLGLCSAADLEKAIALARARARTVRAPKPAAAPPAAAPAAAAPPAAQPSTPPSSPTPAAAEPSATPTPEPASQPSSSPASEPPAEEPPPPRESSGT
jgi:hypothetical protein